MSSVQAYLADLRTAVGDRLPFALVEARLREARGHLTASAKEFGEAEAIRRYGQPRIVADNLVRAHRGYDARNVWRLALPLAAAFLLFGASEVVAKVRLPRQGPEHYGVLSAEAFTALLFSLGFVLRVAQTRRWLAGPMIAAQAVTIVLLGVLANVRAQSIFVPEPRRVDARGSFTTGRWSLGPAALRPLSRDEIESLAWEVYDFGAFWIVLNAATLGLAALTDRRHVRRT